MSEMDRKLWFLYVDLENVSSNGEDIKLIFIFVEFQSSMG